MSPSVTFVITILVAGIIPGQSQYYAQTGYPNTCGKNGLNKLRFKRGTTTRIHLSCSSGNQNLTTHAHKQFIRGGTTETVDTCIGLIRTHQHGIAGLQWRMLSSALKVSLLLTHVRLWLHGNWQNSPRQDVGECNTDLLACGTKFIE